MPCSNQLYKAFILTDNCRLSITSATALHMWVVSWVAFINKNKKGVALDSSQIK
jgi:hypothetical protein